MSAYDEELLEEEDEETPMAERDLADDAQWKIIQKNTFTRWANEHLKTVNKNIANLDSDLSDGLRLVALVEVLSGKKFKFVNRRPNFRTQKLENVTMALEFLERDEGIRIVNIDSGDIVDSKLKLILGLIWTLILHYSISMPMWEGEEPQPQEGGPTPKQRLLNWIQGKVPDMPIKNFTTDWNDGKAIGALVDALAPGLCPDWEDWDPKKAKQNAKEAMDAAEKWLDVPQLIKPDEITNPKIDELSMMTYLSQFPKAKLKPGAPLRPRINANKVRAYGPGLEAKGNHVGSPAKFTVETFSAGKGELEILVLDPKGKQQPCQSNFNNDRNQTYSCQYVPAMEGEYRVIIKWAEKEIHKSPWKVLVEGAAGDASKVTASGPGLEKSGVVVSKKTHFQVFTKGPPVKGRLASGIMPSPHDAGKGTVEVTITDPQGHRDKVKPTIHPVDKDGVVLVEYTAVEMGLHSVSITYSSKAIPKSPFGVNVSSAINPKAVYATGRGIQPRGVRVKQNAEFKVHTKDGGKGEVKVQIIGPGGVNLNCKVTPSKTEEGVYECLYIPPKVGQYVINITFGGQHITKSPFRVDVGPEKFSKIVAFGPGLEGGVVNQPACFTVETNGEVGALGFSIEGPSQAKIDCKDNGDGSADVTYWPTSPGEYAIHIMCNDEDIPQAPYMAQIQPATTAFDASKVIAKGPGLEKDGVTVGKPAEFTVDARKAGKAPLHITCIDANYKPVEVTVKDNRDGTFACKYTAKSAVRHTIIITWGTVGIPKSPFRVNVTVECNPGKVKVYGPGVEKGVKTYVKTHFTVDCRAAGPGDVAIALTDDKGKDVPCNTIDNKDGTFTVEYEPKTPGTYTVQVYFATKEVPQSPIKVKVESSIDLSKVTVKGLETPIPLGETRKITIITTSEKKKDLPCKVTVMTPKNKTVELTTKKSPDGYTCDFKPLESGPHKVTITYNNKPVPDSPFSVEVTAAGKKIPQVEVKGLETPVEVGEARPISIITTSMPKKDAPCKVTCTNPRGKTVELPVKKSPEGYTTTWTPTDQGPHKVAVDFDKKPVPNSPFPVEVVPKGSKAPGKEKPKGEITVKGLDTPIQTGEKRVVTVVTTNAPKKDAPCTISTINPKGRSSNLKTKPVAEGYEAVFSPWDTGIHKVKVEYDGKEVPDSPFDVEVFKINVSAVVVKGLDKPIPLGETRQISIITKDAGKSDLPCKVIVTTPKGQTEEIPTEKSPEGYISNFTPKEPGEHKVKVEYATKEVPKSPFTVHVEVSDITPKKVGKPTEAAPEKIEPKKAAPTKAAPGEGGVTVKGLDTPVSPGEKRPVLVDTTKAPKKDAPCKLSMTNPKGRTVELKTKQVPDGYETTFSSWDKGTHVIKVEYDGKEIPESPFNVEVEKIDISKVTVKGLDTPIPLGETRKVTILTHETGRADAPCAVISTSPKGKTEDVPTEKIPEGYICNFTPKEKGDHKVKVTYAGKEVPNSPFSVNVEAIDISGVKVKGLEKPIMVGEKRTISIITTSTGKKDLPCRVHVTNPKGVTTELFTSTTPDGHETFFTPTDLGKHTVKVEVAGQEVPGSPFPVTVTKFEQRIDVEGLDTPMTMGEKRDIKVLVTAPAKPNRFAPEPTCKITVQNPKGRNFEPKMDKTSKGFETFYQSNEPGPHIFKVEYNGKEIPDSPITCEVEKLEIRKIDVKGLETPIEVGEKRPIQVITKDTGKPDAPCKVTAIAPKGDTKDLPTKKIPEGFETLYAPLEVGPHKIKVEYANREVPKSPYPVEVQPKSGKPKETPVTVKGLETPVTVGEKRPITVTTGKPDAPCKVTATNPKGKPSDVPTKKIKDGYEATFAPLEEGPYKVKVEYAGKEAPGSPFAVEVKPKTDVSSVEVKGLETPVQPNEKRKISIITKATKTPNAPCKVIATNPVGKPTTLPTQKTKDGYEATFAPLETGPHTIRVDFDNKELPKSPFAVNVEQACDLSKVEIKGLEKPVEVDEFRPIMILTKATGNEDAPCKVTGTTPTGRTMFLPTKKVPGGYESTFNPTQMGPHKIKVEVAEKEVPKSPITTNVEAKLDIKKLQVKGLENPIMMGETRPISIITAPTGKPDLPCKVLAKGPRTPYKELPTKKTKDGYECAYTPTESGNNSVKVIYADKEVPKSPYHVDVQSPVDITKVQIKGLEKPVDVGETRPITIDTSSTGKPDAPCRVSVTNPKGKTAELPAETAPEGYKTLFAPLEPGPHKVNVEFAGQPVPDSPFSVDVMPAAEVGAVQVKGLETPIEVGEARPVQINTAKTGKPDAPCRVTATNPKGQTAELPTQKTPEGYQTVFAPLEEGPHKVNVNFAEKEVPKSPFTVQVEPACDVGKVEVMGLETPIKVGEPRPITIMTSTTGKPDAPCKVNVTNPRGQTVELPTRKIPEGYTATMAPQEVGPHRVNVDFNGKEVPKSPFNVMAEPAIDFSKVKVTGLEKPVEVGEIRPITVDTAQTGVVDAPCQVTSTNPVGQVRELPLTPTPVGYEAQFAPLEEGPHMVAVKYAGKEVPKSPFPVQAVPQGPPAAKVKAYGPGLERGVSEEPCKFTIDTREVTQPGGIGVTVEGPAESKIECRDNQNGTCDVTYYPEVPGEYNINVTYADEHIPNSPFKAQVMPSGKIDVSKVRAYGPGLEPGVFLDSPTGFTVDAKSVAPKGEGKVRAIVTSPSGQRTESLVKNNDDGTYDVLYTPYEQGPNSIDVTYENIPIPQSPIQVNATPGCDASRVKAYGTGLEGGNTDTKQTFTVDVKGAGQGGLALAIDGPAETQINCKDNRDGTCEVEYVPVKKGDYDITVKFADQHITGSPFHVGITDVVNPNKVRCYGPGLDTKEVPAGKPATFTVDATDAGQAPLDVTYTDQLGQKQPADIIPVAEGKYECTYYPVDEGKCQVEVTYANQQVPKSPFNMQVQPGSPADKVRLLGEGIKPTVPASIPVEFTIDTRDAGVPGDVDVVIQRPDGTYIRPTVINNQDGTYTVKYTPEDCGPYNVSITFGGEPIKGAPFKTVAIPTGDASKCKITDGLQQTIPVQKETMITVDASQAGTGKVTCRIRSPTGAEIDIDIVENVDGTFNIQFTPANPGDYCISIKFGGQSIPEGDYIIQSGADVTFYGTIELAVDDAEWQEYLCKQNPQVGEDFITPDQIDSVQAAAPGAGLYQPAEFRIPVGPIFNFVTAYVVMPSGKKAYPKIEDNKDGTVTVRYQPQETGLHELHLCYNQQEIAGSPFQFHVDAVNSGFVTAYGPGLSHGVVGVPSEFTIVTKDAGAGGLSLAIEGPSKTEIKCKDNEDGTCTVTYLPTAPGEYNITVKFADKNISGSPFVAKVTAGEPKQRAQIGRSSEVSLKVTETDITNLTASIRSPSKKEEPCMLKRLPNGHLGISFTPRETGEHLVNVYRNGVHIANSPFTIMVGETELGNAGKVKVYGKGLEEGMANEVNEFIVDTRDAGYGGLSLSIEGPSKADIECLDNEDGTCRVTYKPTEPGTYIINIKFADEHVPASPFKVKIGGEPSERVIERIMRHREAVDVSHVGSECELSLKIPGTSPFDMTASVTSPSGVTELCDVVSLDDCHYSIKFIPKEMGIHTVSVKHKDMHIPGSPFQFTVGPIAGGGAHKVHAAGLGLIRGEVSQPNEFNIYTREAGAGGLSIAIEGPSKAEVDFEDRKDGSCGVTYQVTEPGEYLISIKFNDEHIPESPFRVPITPSIGDARKISVQALQSKGLAIGKPCSFVVNFNGAPKGKLQARVVSPSGSEDEALVQEIDEGEYAVRFIPRENGPHLIYISFDGCQIPDSPFRIQVGTVHADPGMVQAYGDGLKTGKTGQTAKFIVNTVNAGSGALSVTVEGPSKVKLECREVDDGYEFSYTPTAPGDYLITIKYAGTNIAGSPFKARIEGQGKPSGFQEQASVVVETVTKTSSMSKFASFMPFVSDASKVTVEGNGIKKGYRNKQCTFNVDTSQAGHNMLFIGMIGPKGPCEELCVKHYPGQPYKITYLVKERGDYMLAIKWGEEHIPGSPFYVKVE
ncbi:filamin-A-like isoform X5 [Mercenaria mercenaria]|uniref:filamin-A-like isoform X5 n=1 Tax=Mercenaria mercenaria TaxID=6596 RepID=UPI00234ECD1F|nr:filamin-A-like isoform X5 [Mercenaria mercenaria]